MSAFQKLEKLKEALEELKDEIVKMAGESETYSESKEETSFIEEKKEEEEDTISLITSSTCDTICQICLDAIAVHLDDFKINECCNKAFHPICIMDLYNHDPSCVKCPNCRAEMPLAVFNFNNAYFFLAFIFFL